MNIKKLFILNIIFFTIIISTISYHYSIHFKSLKKEILSYVKSQAISVAKRIEISATNVFKSQKFIKIIIENNLKSQAKFIDLMNSIEKFKKDELKDFATEAGLSMVCIVSKDYKVKFPKTSFCSQNNSGLIFLKNQNLILYALKGHYSDATVITGIFAKNYYENEKNFSIKGLVHRIISQRQDIREIKILNKKSKNIEVKLINNSYYIVKVPFEAQKNKTILIKIDALYPLKIIDNFKHNIHVFIIVMIIMGIIGNILVYLIQKRYIEEIKDYEKKIAINEKYVSLGKSAGIIAHEIRNPLNAVSIGFQRIMYETDIGQNKEYKNLLNSIFSELKRIDGVIASFIDYSKPLKIKIEKIILKELISSSLELYKANLKIKNLVPDDFCIIADKNLFNQIVHNLIKNATENKTATYLKIFISDNSLIFENDGINEEIDCNKIFEPYFTTKTKGAGLGLAVVKKIVESHNWEIECKSENNIIQFIIKIKE